MEVIVSITLNALIFILGIICFLQRLIIKANREDFDTVQEKVWGLQDKYSIPDEEIRACFCSEHN